MSKKRVLLFSLLFSVLGGSTIYYMFAYIMPPILHPLRKDSIPAGAYVVPWMRPNPRIRDLPPQLDFIHPTYDIDVVMASALKLNMTFHIVVPNGTRVVPSTVYLGHDSDYLYMGGKFIGLYTNPASINGTIRPIIFEVFFDVANDGVLEQPESGSSLGAYVDQDSTGAYIYHDMMWMDYDQDLNHGNWGIVDNIYPNLEADAFGEMSSRYDNSTGTVIMLMSRFLSKSAEALANGLQIKRGERWVVGFYVEVGFNTNSEAGKYVDGWPRNAYPYLTNDASWWPKLAVDLTNPPPEYT